MKVSIITAAYNSAKTVGDAIKSVLSQTYPDIEYLIIDGGSTDGTLDIVDKYRGRIAKIISEKDGGMYDALNKGIKLASGDIIGILNSDDFYSSDDSIATVVKEFERSGADCVWGDLIIVDRDDIDKVARYWRSSPYESGSFQRGWHPPHTAFFVRRRVYERYGMFRTDLSTSADYELMLRFIEKDKISTSYITKVLVKMRSGGASSSSLFSWVRGNVGSYKAFRLNGLKAGPFFLILKPLRKLAQFFHSD